jgi:hypothetical protein
MPVEETMWDVRVTREIDRHDDQMRAVLARAIAKRLPRHKKLVRVVAWSQNAGRLFAPEAGVRRYAVAYEVRFSA